MYALSLEVSDMPDIADCIEAPAFVRAAYRAERFPEAVKESENRMKVFFIVSQKGAYTVRFLRGSPCDLFWLTVGYCLYVRDWHVDAGGSSV